MRTFVRKISHLPILNRVTSSLESHIHFLTHAGTARRRSRLSAKLSVCKTPGDWFSTIRSLFQVTQIEVEICSLIELCSEHQISHILEIGTAQGGTTTLLCQAIPTISLMATVDILPRHRRLLNHLNTPRCSFRIIRGSSQSPRTCSEIENIFVDHPLDLLFIDGDHSYQGVKADFIRFRHLVRDGGLIAFHDIVPAPETGSPLAGHRWVGGVPLFWQEVKNLGVRHWEFVESWDQHGYGIGVVEVNSTLKAASP